MTAVVEDQHIPPRIRVETTSKTVWRVEPDGSRFEVRGRVVDGVIFDYETPQETPLTYTDGVESTPDPVAMPPVGVWLIPPAAPELGAHVIIDKRGGYSSLTRKSHRDVVEVPGRDDGALVVEWGRGARTGEIVVHVLNRENLARLEGCLLAPGPHFLSTPRSHWPVNGLLSWVSIGDDDFDPKGPDHRERWRVKLPIVATSRPERVVDSAPSWRDLGDLTWAQAGDMTWRQLMEAL